MSSAMDRSLSVKREALRAQLTVQRQVIARQLQLPDQGDYPRSETMRFFKRNSVPAATAIGGVATLFGGVRLYRTISAVLAALGTLRATSRK